MESLTLRERQATRPSVALSGIVRGEPKLVQIQEAVARLAGQAADIVLDKVVAHLEEPRKHPLPSAVDAPERRLHALLAGQPARRRRKVLASVRPRLGAETRRQRYGELAAIDLRSATPIMQQIRPRAVRLLPKLEPAEAERIRRKFEEAAPAAQPRGATATRFVLRLDRVACEEKTRELFEGRDEIQLAVSAFNQEDLVQGKVTSSEVVDLGTFREGEARDFSDTELASFEVAAGTILPQGFRALFVLSELDPDRFRLSLGGILASIVGAIVGAILLPQAAPIVLLAGLALFIGFVHLAVGSVDDEFEPGEAFEFVDALDDVFPQQSITLSNSGRLRGRYKLDYSWSLE